MASRFVCLLSIIVLQTVVLIPAHAQISLDVEASHFHDGAARVKAKTTGSSNVVTDTPVKLAANAPDGYTKVNLVFDVSPSIDQPNKNPGDEISVTIREEELDRDITIRLIATGPAPHKEIADTAKIHVDSRPPKPLSPVVERYPGGSGTIRIPFDQNDLAANSIIPDAFRVLQEFEHQDGTSGLSPVFAEGQPIPEAGNMSVLLNFRNLDPGNYWIVIDKLRDVVGNAMTPRATTFNATAEPAVHLPFTVPGGQLRGEQVEYPRFLRPRGTESEFDPGDRVDTRVVQLYYFRDARLVAQYINRNIQDLNQQGYDEAHRFAEQARQKADQSIDERRFQETLAVEAATRTREIQHRLDEAKGSLDQASQNKDALTIQKAQLENAIQLTSGGDSTTLGTKINETQSQFDQNSRGISTSLQSIAVLENELDQARQNEINGLPDAKTLREKAEADLQAERDNHVLLVEEKGKLQNKLVAMKSLQANSEVNKSEGARVDTEISSLKADLAPGKLPQQLQDQQVKEIDDRNRIVRAEASELRAAQEQFRREVAAGMADRNSYAKGNVFSVDPVTQVTISVVGTSRLQLRGPIKGVNKICRMIHQLDSPVGQVKIGIHTVQVNGEHGDRMDFVYERINQEIAHSRFLVSTSGQLLRRAAHEVAAEVAIAADQGYLPENCPPDLMAGVVSMNGSTQTTSEQRDRRYLYAFFGSDFISELEEMDSELLNTENKMLSLHSMDTVSLAGALFVMAHADHPVRQRIVMRFQELLAGELPQRETEYVQALTHVTSHGKSLQNRFRTAVRIDNKNAAEIYFNAARTYHFPNTISYFNDQIPGQGTLNPVQYATIKMAQSLKAQLVAEMELKNHVLERSLLETKIGETEGQYRISVEDAAANERKAASEAVIASQGIAGLLAEAADTALKGDGYKSIRLDAPREMAQSAIENMREATRSPSVASDIIAMAIEMSKKDEVTFIDNVWNTALIACGIDTLHNDVLLNVMAGALTDAKTPGTDLSRKFRDFHAQIRVLIDARRDETTAMQLKADKEEELFSQRLLDQFIDEQEEKSVELMEALRSHSSNVDNYLKRLAIAVEDDVAAQFYEPAFQRIRRVSRTWDVTLGQIETTTVLTNNRTLAKVSPAATFEFDLPQRDILLTEALNGSKALANEYGNLLKDGTFLAGTAMLSGQPPAGVIGDNAPIQGIPGLQQNQDFGSELQKLIPDPAIYKFETGTGFEIQPIIQPDGHSIVYGFDYMYSTNVREPVRADEKHLGRIKRHFVHTDVQTSSYELREISRYTVALKASRTDRGVPLFEDLPGVGAAFRPLPSEESSLQTNIILGSSTIYPTVFDLMGLRWSAYVDQLSSPAIAAEKETQSNRREELKSHLLNTTRDKVNKRIRLQLPREPRVNHIAPGYVP